MSRRIAGMSSRQVGGEVWGLVIGGGGIVGGGDVFYEGKNLEVAG